jgi:hypothetical protein
MNHAIIEPLAPPPLHPIGWQDILKRIGIWTFVCGVASVPSFAFAWEEAHRGAMAIGVVLFIAAYVATSCLPFVRRLCRKPFMKLSVMIGYSLRLAATAIFPYAWIGDLLPGMLSVGLTERIFGVSWNSFDDGDASSFAATLFTTIVQGILLNIIVAIVITIIYFAQRLFRRNPQAVQPRGFEVLPTANLVGPQMNADKKE